MNDERCRLDAHVHLLAADREKNHCYMSASKKNGVVAWYLKKYVGVGPDATDLEFDSAYAAKLARLLREAKHIDKAVVFAMDGAYDERGRLLPTTEAMVSNEWAIEAAGLYPDVFLFGASIHPARPDALEELDRCASAGAVCVKWVPPSMNIDPASARYQAFYERMLEHGLPLTSHTGYEHSVRVYDQSLGDPERLRFPLEMGLKVVACHAGTSGWYHRVEYFPNLVRLAEQFERVYADTSALSNVVRSPYLKRINDAIPLAGRLIEGTDFPVPPMPILWPFTLGPAEAVAAQLVRNPFDRDVLSKRAAGFDDEHFLLAHDIFIPRRG